MVKQPYSPFGAERTAADDAAWAEIMAGAPAADAIGSDAVIPIDLAEILGGASAAG